MMIDGQLSASPHTRGRYIIDEGDGDGPELTSGGSCDIFLGGQWIGGRVEHGLCYLSETLYADPGFNEAMRGYYFIADDGSACGLCVGMRVRA